MKTLLAALLLVAQDKYPVEDHAWLRYKPGTWVENKVVVEASGRVVETLQKQKLKRSEGDDFTIQVTETLNGKVLSTRENQSSLGVVTGKDTLSIGGKEYPCTISVAKGRRAEGETEWRSWMPKGNKYPLKVVIKQPNFESELLAVAVDEKLTIDGRDYLCAKLEGKVQQGASEGTMTLWVSQEIPGSAGRMDLVLSTPGGEVKINSTAVEVHEEK